MSFGKRSVIDLTSALMFWDRLTYSADSSAQRRCFIVFAVRNGFDRQRHVAVPLLGETHYAGIAPGAYKLIVHRMYCFAYKIWRQTLEGLQGSTIRRAFEVGAIGLARTQPCSGSSGSISVEIHLDRVWIPGSVSVAKWQPPQGWVCPRTQRNAGPVQHPPPSDDRSSPDLLYFDWRVELNPFQTRFWHTR